MNLTIELPEGLAATLNSQAHASGVTPSNYARHVIEEALKKPHPQPAKPKKSAYGLLAQYGPGPSKEEIDENRREMFRGFGEDVP